MKEVFDDPKKGLSYLWSLVAASLLWYIVYRWGEKTEILTLVLGILGGTVIGGIFGLWFAGTTSKPNHPTINPDGTTTTANIEVTQTTPTTNEAAVEEIKPEENK